MWKLGRNLLPGFLRGRKGVQIIRRGNQLNKATRGSGLLRNIFRTGTTVGLGKSVIDKVLGGDQKQKKQPSQEGAVRFLQGSGADPSSAVIDADVTGRETIGGELSGFTQVPDLNTEESTGYGVDVIIQEINKINENIMAIRNAMAASALIEANYRKNIEEDLQQDIADRDKQRSQGRSADRRDNLNKKGGFFNDLTKKPAATAKSAGVNIAGAIGLELASALLGGDDSGSDSDDNKTENRGFGNRLLGLLDGASGNLTDFDGQGGKTFGSGRIIGGLLDAASFNLTDFDKEGGKPSGFMRGITGGLDALTGDRWDFDRQGKPDEISGNTTNFGDNIFSSVDNSVNPAQYFNPEFVSALKDSGFGIEPLGDTFDIFDLRSSKGNKGNTNGMTSGKGVSNIIPDGDPSRSIVWEYFQRGGK